MPQFLFDFIRTGDRLCDLLAKKLMVAPTHPLHGLLQCFLRGPAFTRGFRVSLFSSAFDKKRSQPIEKFALARVGEFLGEPGQDLIKQGHGPATFK